jgi:hypothetical protein
MKHETIPQTVLNLLAGRERIVRGGLCRGAMVSEDGKRFCALGAIQAPTLNSPEARLLFKALPPGWGAVTQYSDWPKTTKEDILALYDRAIALGME